MKLKIAIILFLFFGNSLLYAQEEENAQPTHELKGQVIDSDSKKPLADSHIMNLNSVRGAITNDEGFFTMNVKVSDTVYVSHLGYASIKLKVTKDLLKGNDLVISLYEESGDLGEVVVKTHNLIGVLEIDARNVPKDIYNRIYINGLPQTYETGRRKAKEYNTAVDAIFNPIDFLYNRFGKKPKQLRRLKKLRQEDELRQILEAKYNRELVLEYLKIDSVELKQLLDDCNHSEYFIKNASDLQLIEAILDCYENYKAVQKGSTKRQGRVPLRN